MEIDDIVDEAADKKESVIVIEDDTASQPSSPEKSGPSASLPSAKPKRKVLKKKTTMNARGHMGKLSNEYILSEILICPCTLVTEEVWEWEEVDGEEIPSPATTTTTKPKPAPKTTTKKASNKKPTAQTNLFSFFNKK